MVQTQSITTSESDKASTSQEKSDTMSLPNLTSTSNLDSITNNNTVSLINENPSVFAATQECFDGMSSSHLTGKVMDNVDNMTTSGMGTSLFIYEQLDNHQAIERQLSIDNAPKTLDNSIGFQIENEYPQLTSSRKRCDSAKSEDSLDSSSSSEIFNSEYTDTVSSTMSTAFLINNSPESDEELQDETMQSQQALTNDGYMSCSSTEVLNDDESCHEDLVSLGEEKEEQEEKSEESPMLQVNGSDVFIDMETETDNNGGQNLNDFVHHSLTPIQENQVISFSVEEVEPKLYTKITDNIIIADESFLFNSVSNLGELELGNNGKRAATMHNLHERSSFLDLTEVSKVGKICQKALIYLKDDMMLGSLASLNTIVAKENSKDPSQSLSLISERKNEKVLKKGNFSKNLIALSISITLLYTAIGSVRNLQSSINHEGGVGVAGLAANYLGYVVGSMFSSSIVQNFHPRKCIIANLLPNLLYIAANLYPTMWVMLPISLIQGISLAIVANATSTYITFLAKGCAENVKSTFSHVSGKFFGTYCLIYQSHIIVGNLIASLILTPPAETSDIEPFAFAGQNTTDSSLSMYIDNSTAMILNQTSSNASHLQMCGPNFCQHFDIGGSKFAVSLETKGMLFGVYIACIILSLLNAVFFMESLNKNLFKSSVAPLVAFKTQMSSLTSFFVNVKFLLLLPLLMFSAMQFAFVSAEFVKGYVTCPLGLHMIGYTMICFGICSSTSSYFCGLLNKYVGRIPFIVAASFKSLTKMTRTELQMNPAFPSLLSVCCNG